MQCRNKMIRISAPSVSFEQREFVANEGETIDITADLVSDPKPTVSWESKKEKNIAKKTDRFS